MAKKKKKSKKDKEEQEEEKVHKTLADLAKESEDEPKKSESDGNEDKEETSQEPEEGSEDLEKAKLEEEEDELDESEKGTKSDEDDNKSEEDDQDSASKDDDSDEDNLLTQEELEELDPKDYFLEMVKAVNQALNTEEGKKLNCRMKIVVDGQEAYIYQGLRQNVYARLFVDKPHRIYRYTMKKLLTNHKATKPFFTPDKIRS